MFVRPRGGLVSKHGERFVEFSGPSVESRLPRAFRLQRSSTCVCLLPIHVYPVAVKNGSGRRAVEGVSSIDRGASIACELLLCRFQPNGRIGRGPHVDIQSWPHRGSPDASEPPANKFLHQLNCTTMHASTVDTSSHVYVGSRGRHAVSKEGITNGWKIFKDPCRRQCPIRQTAVFPRLVVPATSLASAS